MRKILAPIFIPLSYLYRKVMDLRNDLYDKDVINVHQFQIPIVSVGNLTLGGTGKTPIICELISWAREQGLKPAMISRGYKGNVSGVTKVNPAGSPEDFGDEPFMVANKFKDIPVYVSPNRVAGVEQILKAEDVKIIFADDAFQHRRMGRVLDILVIDCSEKIENYQVIPREEGVKV